MNQAGYSFLRELRDFLQFLRSLWGVLAGISVLFPLSNAFFTVVPLADGQRPFQNLAPSVVTVITMTTCVFLTFATFGRRARFGDATRRGRYARYARACFVGALVALGVYVLAPNSLYTPLITNNPNVDLGTAAYDGLFAALYVLTFALLTEAFLVLAMLEYFPDRERAPGGTPTATASGDTDESRDSQRGSAR